MKFYTYDRITGAHIATGDAHPSPEEAETYLLPAWATFKPVPENIPEGHGAFWDGNDWQVLEGNPEVAMQAAIGYLATPDEKAILVDAAVRGLLDLQAKVLGFRDIDDAMLYPAGEKTQKQRDGNQLRAWRVDCDAEAEKIKAEVAGTIEPMLAVEVMLARMPTLVRDFDEAPGVQPFVEPDEPLIKYAVAGSATHLVPQTQEELDAIFALNEQLKGGQ